MRNAQVVVNSCDASRSLLISALRYRAAQVDRDLLSLALFAIACRRRKGEVLAPLPQ